MMHLLRNASWIKHYNVQNEVRKGTAIGAFLPKSIVFNGIMNDDCPLLSTGNGLNAQLATIDCEAWQFTPEILTKVYTRRKYWHLVKSLELRSARPFEGGKMPRSQCHTKLIIQRFE